MPAANLKDRAQKRTERRECPRQAAAVPGGTRGRWPDTWTTPWTCT